MNKDLEREAFERVFSAPCGIEWIDDRQGYRITSDDDYWWEPEGQAHFRGYLGQWIGWQAASLASCQGILDSSGHIPDATKMIQGDVQCMGNLYFNDEDSYDNALVITFADRAGLKAALDSRQCRFTVFGGEV